MPNEVGIDVLDPVHFHGALFLQEMYAIAGLTVNPVVNVYYSVGNNLAAFTGMLKKIQPETKGWKIRYYPSGNPLEDMLKAKTGNALVLACPNVDKIGAIHAAVESGNYRLILADKPWVIEPDGIPTLEAAVEQAMQKGTILQDIMTERYETGTIIQQLLMQNQGVFGDLVPGNEEQPAIFKKSTHIFDKSRLGVIRPPEYFDVGWQGEGIIDVSTHLIDMVFCCVKPDSEISLEDVQLLQARRWVTEVPQNILGKITKGFRTSLLSDGRSYTMTAPLSVFSNGSFVYRLASTCIANEVIWNVQGNDDEHYSRAEGTMSAIEVIKGPDDKHQRVYIIPKGKNEDSVRHSLETHAAELASMGYEGISIAGARERLELKIPERSYTTHFQHFAEVTTAALGYLSGKPFNQDVEYSRILAKYHLTMAALQMARNN